MDSGSENEEDLLEQQDQQDRVTQLLKSELEDLHHRREQFVQLVVQLQRKGRFMESDDSSVTSVSNIGQMASPIQKVSIEEELRRENRLLKMEIDALNLQMEDAEQV